MRSRGTLGSRAVTMRKGPANQHSHPTLPPRHPRDTSARDETPAAGVAATRAAHTLPPPVFAPGARVANRFRIRQLLGRGGMGEVYEAEDEALGIAVALKALNVDLAKDRQGLVGLKREVLLARSVAHLHVCRVYDLGQDVARDTHPNRAGSQGLWFLTMELLRGETLAERLLRCGRLSAAEALPLAQQTAAGLGAAHRSGIMHLDLKSGNIMIVRDPDRPEERAVITDFGLARMTGAMLELESTGGSVVGTPAYMSPEQVRGEELGPASDLYSLGVVLFEMVTGQLPFSGRTAREVALRRLSEPPPPPRSLAADVDPRWEEAILRCLARDPAARYARAEDVAEVLGEPGRRLVRQASPADRSRHFLPAERDAFVGRDAELAALSARLEGGARLVSLVGAAGMGKTRLALRFGWQNGDSWPGGAWFADLTDVKSTHAMASAVASALGVPLGRTDPIEQLGHAIAGRGRCLVILDNFEQLVEYAGETVGQWLARAEDVQFLVTSRHRLNLREEAVQAVEPLALEAGIELFMERARWQRPGFALGSGEAAALRDLVISADGMPLAIELAAARLRLMSVTQLATRMRERFRLLRSELGGRHSSLRGAIDSSWDLLAPWEKSAWAQCAVFEGGFTLEAAEGVLDLSAWPRAPWTVDVLQSLVDKSLLRTWVPEARRAAGRRRPPEARFGMYVSLQEYAREKLRTEDVIPAGGATATAERAAEERHGAWYAGNATQTLARLAGRHGAEELERVGADLENILAACHRAIKRTDWMTAVQAYMTAWEVIEVRGPFATAVELGRTLVAELSRTPSETRLLVQALNTLGEAEWRSGRIEEARATLQAALERARRTADSEMTTRILLSLGNTLSHQGAVEEAIACYSAIAADSRATGNIDNERTALSNLGLMYKDQGRTADARAAFEASLALAREQGNRRFEAVVHNNLGDLLAERGHMEEAEEHFHVALAIHREADEARSECIVLGNLGEIASLQGRREEAQRYLATALTIARRVGDRRHEGILLGSLGRVHLMLGETDPARAHLEAALAIAREVGDRRTEGILLNSLGELLSNEPTRTEARALLEAGLATARDAGYRRLEGIVLRNLGHLDREESRTVEAQVRFEESLAIAREVGDLPVEGIVLGDWVSSTFRLDGWRWRGKRSRGRKPCFAKPINPRSLPKRSWCALRSTIAREPERRRSPPCMKPKTCSHALDPASTPSSDG